jgi:leucyl/phenylalanyl-tRNA---protein transferase
MAITNFPPIDLADEHGLLAVGGDLEVDSLLLAYKKGVFPWPINKDFPLAWFSPDPRGLFFTDELTVSRSLAKVIRHCPYTITYNQAFEAVIKSCQQIHRVRQQTETWITEEIVEAYIRLHRAGHAYSVEVWNSEGVLVGGLYGVLLGSYISGESMFYLAPNASKLALVTLIRDLAENQIPWIDTQMVTPVVGALGGREVPRKQFIALLNEALKDSAPAFLRPGIQA